MRATRTAAAPPALALLAALLVLAACPVVVLGGIGEFVPGLSGFADKMPTMPWNKCDPVEDWPQRLFDELEPALHCQGHVPNVLAAQLGPHYPPNKAVTPKDPLVFFFVGGPGIGKTYTSEELLPKIIFNNLNCAHHVDIRMGLNTKQGGENVAKEQRRHADEEEAAIVKFVERHPRGLILVDDAHNMHEILARKLVNLIRGGPSIKFRQATFIFSFNNNELVLSIGDFLYKTGGHVDDYDGPQFEDPYAAVAVDTHALTDSIRASRVLQESSYLADAMYKSGGVTTVPFLMLDRECVRKCSKDHARRRSADLKAEGKVHALVTRESVHNWVVGHLDTYKERWPALPFSKTGCKDIKIQWNTVMGEIGKKNRKQRVEPAAWYMPWAKAQSPYPLHEDTVELSVVAGRVTVTASADREL